MPLTKVQQGTIGQYETAKLMMMGSAGKLEVAAPMTDDDRRDQEIHTRGEFDRALALQIKTTMHLVPQGRTFRISFTFNVIRRRIVSHPLFWYLFAYLDPKTMAFGDPLFLVDSATLHASMKRRQGKTYLAFHASVATDSHDEWVRYRVHPHDLGKRVLEILHPRQAGTEVRLSSLQMARDTDVLLVGRRGQLRTAR